MKMFTFSMYLTIALALFSTGSVYGQERKKVDIDSFLTTARPGDIIYEESDAIWPFYLEPKVDAQIFSPGPTQVKIYYSPLIQCTFATIKISEIHRLQHIGDLECDLPPK